MILFEQLLHTQTLLLSDYKNIKSQTGMALLSLTVYKLNTENVPLARSYRDEANQHKRDTHFRFNIERPRFMCVIAH